VVFWEDSDELLISGDEKQLLASGYSLPATSSLPLAAMRLSFSTRQAVELAWVD